MPKIEIYTCKRKQSLIAFLCPPQPRQCRVPVAIFFYKKKDMRSPPSKRNNQTWKALFIQNLRLDNQ